MTTQTTDGLSTRAARRAAGNGAVPAVGDRLPVPPRQRRPALAALAVVLILGGAALAATLVLSSGQKQEYLLVNKDVAVGEVLTPQHFLQQPLSSTQSSVFAPVPVSDFYTRVNGKRALVALRKGSLLTQGTFGDRITPARGLTQLALNVPEGQYPAGLQASDIVRVLHTPRAANNNSAPTGEKLVPRGATLVRSAYVTSVVKSATGQNGVVVGIEVNDEELAESPNSGLPAVAAANALNAITVIRLDPTSEYDKGSQ
ncbi:MAG TPA: hypothetical protein VE547_15390 [Mycobacteriales bacterium]|jgi:hypothetical protein|nr:hypothetical protein [Mycobacteriales bacterium]